MDAKPLTGKAAAAIAHSNSRINAYEGSVRSGKTFTTLLDWIRYCRTGPAGLLLITGRTERTIINNLVMPLIDLLGRQRVLLNRGSGIVTILGRECLIIGANNEAARTKIQGLTLAGAYVDEAGTLPESYFNMLVSRLSVAGAKLFLTSNPEGPAHWLKTKWLDRARIWIDREGVIHHKPDFDPDKDPDLARFTFVLDDNPNLPADYVRNLKASYTGLWYRRYINAEWVAAEGAVYDCWDPARHVVTNLPDMVQVVALGVDHGMTNPSAGILLGLGRDGVLYAMDEWWLYPTGAQAKATVEQQSASLRAWMAARPAPRWMAVDPAAAAFRVQLHTDGVKGLINADNDVSYGIALVASLLAAGQLRIHASCVNLIRELPSYSWDDKASEKGQDKPVKVADHAADALRYAIATTEVQWRKLLRDPEPAAA